MRYLDGVCDACISCMNGARFFVISLNFSLGFPGKIPPDVGVGDVFWMLAMLLDDVGDVFGCWGCFWMFGMLGMFLDVFQILPRFSFFQVIFPLAILINRDSTYILIILGNFV